MRYNRFGFFGNKHNTGSQEQFFPEVTVNESTNASALVYTIDTNLPSTTALFYTFTGNVTNSDIQQGNVGTISLDVSGNSTVTLDAGTTFTDTSNIRQGAFEIRSNSTSGPIVYTGTTKTYTPLRTVDINSALANGTVGTNDFSNRYQNVPTDNNKTTIFWGSPRFFGLPYYLAQIGFNSNTTQQSKTLQFLNANVSTIDVEYIVVGTGGLGGTNNNGTPSYSEHAGAGGGAGGEVLVGTFTADTTQTYPIILGNSTTATSIFGLSASVGQDGADCFVVDGVTGAGGNALGYAGSGGSGATNRGNITAGAAGTVVLGNAGQQGYLYEANTSIGGVGGDGYFVPNKTGTDRWIPEAAFDIYVGAGGSGGPASINPSGGIDPPKPRNSNPGFNSSSELVGNANVGPLGNFVNTGGSANPSLAGDQLGFRTFGAGGYGVNEHGSGLLPNQTQTPYQFANGGGILLRFKQIALIIS